MIYINLKNLALALIDFFQGGGFARKFTNTDYFRRWKNPVSAPEHS